MEFLGHINQKIIPPERLDNLLAFWRFKGYKIVFTNGCFDILHPGHIDYLARARQLGTILLIGLNTDDSVRRIKGNNRPINTQKTRATLLASLSFVDAVVLFDQDTPLELIKHVKPDVLVKGSDYKPEDIVGSEVVKEKGGRIETIEFLEGHSTTSLIQKIKSL
jgi:rfaE bifunctional protein nucleotidyltransferase chain/domain